MQELNALFGELRERAQTGELVLDDYLVSLLRRGWSLAPERVTSEWLPYLSNHGITLGPLGLVVHIDDTDFDWRRIESACLLWPELRFGEVYEGGFDWDYVHVPRWCGGIDLTRVRVGTPKHRTHRVPGDHIRNWLVMGIRCCAASLRSLAIPGVVLQKPGSSRPDLIRTLIQSAPVLENLEIVDKKLTPEILEGLRPLFERLQRVAFRDVRFDFGVRIVDWERAKGSHFAGHVVIEGSSPRATELFDLLSHPGALAELEIFELCGVRQLDWSILSCALEKLEGLRELRLLDVVMSDEHLDMLLGVLRKRSFDRLVIECPRRVGDVMFSRKSGKRLIDWAIECGVSVKLSGRVFPTDAVIHMVNMNTQRTDVPAVSVASSGLVDPAGALELVNLDETVVDELLSGSLLRCVDVVKLRGASFSPEVLVRLLSSEHFSEVTELDIHVEKSHYARRRSYNSYDGSPDASVQENTVKAVSNLERATVRSCRPELVYTVLEHVQADALDTLDIEDVDLDVERLIASDALRRVRVLRLSRVGFGGEEGVAIFMGPWGSVRELDLSHNTFNSRGGRELLRHLTSLGELEQLNLSGCGLDAWSLAVLGDVACPQTLTVFDLSNNPVSSAHGAPWVRGILKLMEWAKESNIERIELATEHEEEIMKVLTQAGVRTTFQHLCGTRIVSSVAERNR